MDNFKANLENS